MIWQNQEKKYHTYNRYLRNKYGQKVFKVSLNGHFTCPNKDGSKGLGGCIFCSPSGSGDFAGSVKDDLQTQFDSVKTMMHEKWPNAKYIAYFQANTNTYKPTEALKEMFEASIALDPDIVGLNIGTRCDALEASKIDLLADLNKKTDVTIELGLQSIHEATSEWMNRGHDLACFESAVKALRKQKLEVVVHIINGFPNETESMMLETVEYLNRLDIQGIKIHMLHVMKNTALAKQYHEKPFNLLTKEAYVSIAVKQIERLNPNIIVHRLTGDSPKDLLIAPLWTLKKFVVLNDIDKKMRRQNTYQGKLYQQTD